ncbi:PREDICTED: tryptophan aminotransferase-related protein 3 [Theobroma cacao]|uniref:Tryptophan aminotransferase-related protein 3 n=1 Tax=Theobroma cacao TaxID=3641 RepID=A0AB32UVP6_THECC|nr:PREDICTED: tryptophan aminotransferase-related protein 3 [Theobroma cacao]
MAKITSFKYTIFLSCSSILNLLFFSHYLHGGMEQSYTKNAAAEAEAVAAISCSGHGRAFLDGSILHGKHVCECDACYGGPDCSDFLPDCIADADSGDPMFLEPFWRKHAASSTIVLPGWHRMSYEFNDGSLISKELETQIRKLHAVIGNAVTDGRFIIFGAGATQLLHAAVHALSSNDPSSPTIVVASTPYYPVYREQTEFFNSEDYKFKGDTSLYKNERDSQGNFIELVTSPNNPDGQLKKAVLQGPSVKTIHDLAYYWPHYTPIPAPADEDLMIFTLSKLTGHGGSRFGWAILKDETVYQRMLIYMSLSTYGVPRETQLRVLKLLKVALEREGKEMFDFGYKTMRNRWRKLSETMSMSKRFSIQELEPKRCSFHQKVREPSPAFAWLKCEREEDNDCNAVLNSVNVTGRDGSLFGDESRYVRLSLVKCEDDFDLLLKRMQILVSEENDSTKIMPQNKTTVNLSSPRLNACSNWDHVTSKFHLEELTTDIRDGATMPAYLQ